MSLYQVAVIIQKVPGEAWDEAIDWSIPARDLGYDTIASSSWSVQGADDGLELYDPTISEDGLQTEIWMRGGTVGNYYTVTNTVITTGDRTLTETFLVQLVEFRFLTSPHCI